MKEALDRAGVTGGQLDEVIFGNVIQAGLGQNSARQAEIKAGIPVEVPAITVNRVCVSSAAAMAMAANAIKAGDGDLFLVGGMENMTRAPWVLQDGRSGYRMGMPTDKMYDSMVWDGLWDAFGNYHMGVTAENLCEQFGITREQQDEVAYRSHLNAVAAIDSGRFKDEIVPVVIPQRKGDPVVIDTDECPRRDASLESMAKLKPFFKEGGVVTAGNASALSDGASAVVVTSRKKAAELGRKPIATLVSYATAACAPEIMGLGETKAAQLALKKAGLDRPGTSTSPSSTRRSPALPPSPLARSASIPTSSTSTAAPWLSAIRSATPARAWSSPSSTSCRSAARRSASPAPASAAVRAPVRSSR